MIALLLACASEPRAFDGVVAHLDRDGNGTLEPAEYAPVAHKSTYPDDDGDGHVTGAEVGALIGRTDPATFDPALGQRPFPGPPHEARPLSPEAGRLRETLQFIVEELAFVDPNAALPTASELTEAARGGPESPEGVAVLARLSAIAAAQGRKLPELGRPR